jgi:PAS domain S-box-containing protein
MGDRSRSSVDMVATAWFKAAMDLGFMALPAGLVAYLSFFQTPPLIFRHFLFHEVAIGVSIVLSLFAGWVAWRCYQASGEPALRWMTLAFVGFAVVYAPHGVLTRHSGHDLWMFILFGPASRVVMCAFLLVALLRLGAPADAAPRRGMPVRWLPWLAAIIGVDGLVWALASSAAASEFMVRAGQEGVTMALSLAGIAVIRLRGLRSSMMWLYQLALASFATSAFAFLLTSAWTHLWWLAHGVFAAGFFMLAYGVAQAYLTTRSITHVYNPEQMAAKLAATQAVALAAQQAEQRLKSLFEASPIGIAVSDDQGRLIFCNRRQSEMLGVPLAEMLGRPERDLFVDRSLRDDGAGRAWASGVPVTLEVAQDRADGTRQWSAVSWMPTIFGDSPGLVAWTVDITDRRRAATALEQAKHAAEVANRTKTEFLAAVSHELRTPLNAINGFAEVMVAEVLGPLGNPRYGEYARHILDSGQHLTNLINDVLDVSAVEIGELVLRESVVDMGRIIDSARIMVADRVRLAGLRLEVDVASDLPHLRGDEMRLKQVLLNLLSNAVKFTPAGGLVTVSAWARPGGGLMVSVADTGIGIRDEDKAKALAPFSQVDSGLERRYEGLGLGLSLAVKLTEMHGGSFSLASEPGAGTTATLHFPPQRSLSSATG